MRQLVLALIFFATSPAWAQQGDGGIEADFDGDGKQERASLSQEADERLVVSAGSARLRLAKGLYAEMAGLSVIDVDANDPAHELVVTYGEGELPSVFIYALDGGQLRLLGMLVGRIEAKGNGIVLQRTWEGFWTKTEKFVLEPGRKGLRRVAQELYALEPRVEVVAKKTFPLLFSRTSSEIVANVAADSKIEVLLFGGDDWYLVRSATGLVGWARFKTLNEHTVLPLAG